MKTETKTLLIAGTALALSGLTFSGCGSDSNNQAGTPPVSDGTADLGNFNMTCEGQATQGQQKQVPFQQQQQSSCKKQNFQFQQQKIGDYDVNLDCDARQVIVKSKGFDQQQQTLPIQNDGTVKGQIQYQQQLKNDGRSNRVCWVQYVVDFNGKAHCGGTLAGTLPQPAPSAWPSNLPSPIPSTSANPAGPQDKLSLTTTVSFQQADPGKLQDAGVQGPIVNPNASPEPSVRPSSSPSTSPSPTPSASPSPSPSTSPSPTPSTSPSPSMTPVPSGTPVVFCVVDDPCPLQGTTNLSCGDNSSSSSNP